MLHRGWTRKNVVGIGRILPGIFSKVFIANREAEKKKNIGLSSRKLTLIWAVYPRNWQDVARNSARCH